MRSKHGNHRGNGRSGGVVPAPSGVRATFMNIDIIVMRHAGI